MKRTFRGRAAAGFTLIEVMIVIAIIVALAGLVGVALFARRDEAKVNLVKIDMSSIKAGLKQFRFDFERWPTDSEGLSVLWDKTKLDPDADQTKWKSSYLEDPMPNDKWDQPWGYRAESESDPTKYDLWSNGPDKQEGTDDDILDRPKEDAEGGTGSGSSPPTGGR